MIQDDLGAGTGVVALDFPSAGRLLDSIFADEQVTDLSDLPQIDGYIVDRRLGRGGGGQVFHATREGGDRRLAIKLLNKTIKDRLANSRAWRELDLLSDLRLPGVPPVEGYGLHGDQMYIVTAHVEGLTLADHCEQNNLDARARVELLAKVADAVQRLHERGVLHRDIKPDNIIIDHQGEPVIIDFGIATLVADDATETLTQDGVPMGTPAYMSPEQARGERDTITTRSDVYSLGATACVVLTGKTPHDVSGPLHAAVRRVAQDPPRDPLSLKPALDQSLANILSRALSPASDERYPSAAALAEDLRRWLRNEPIDWQRPGWLKRQALAWRRDPKLFLTRAGAAALLVLCLAISVTAAAKIRTAEERAYLAEKELELNDIEAEQLAFFKRETERLTVREAELKGLETKAIEQKRNQLERAKKADALREYLDGAVILLNAAEDIKFRGLQTNEEIFEGFIEIMQKTLDNALREAEIKKLNSQ